MQRANGRQKANAYRFKPKARETPAEDSGTQTSTSGRGGSGGRAGQGRPGNGKKGTEKVKGAAAATAGGQNKETSKPFKSTGRIRTPSISSNDSYSSSSEEEDEQKPGPSHKMSKVKSQGQLRAPGPSQQRLTAPIQPFRPPLQPLKKPQILTRSSASSVAPSKLGSGCRVTLSDNPVGVGSSQISRSGASASADDGWRQVQRSRVSNNKAPATSHVFPTNSNRPKVPGGQTSWNSQRLPSTRLDSATLLKEIDKKPLENAPHGQGQGDTDAIVTTPKKPKKKKSNVSKEEKQRRRDEAGLKELFKPKDSRIQLIDSDLFQRIKSNNGPPSFTSPSPSTSGVFQFSSTPMNARNSTFPGPPPSGNSVNDFPTLESASISGIPSKIKSFAAAAATTFSALPVEVKTTPKETTLTLTEEGTDSEPPLTPIDPVIVSPKKVKLSKRSITVNLAELLSTTPAPSKSRNAVPNPVANRQISRNKSHHKYDRVTLINHTISGNILDASIPRIIHRGKIRQKKKKASRMKKGILASRMLRKMVSPEVNSTSPPTLEEVTLKLHNLEISQISQPQIDPETGSVFDGISSLALSLPPEKDPLEVEPLPKDGNETGNVFKDLLEEAELYSKGPPPPPSAAVEVVKLGMHSRKFRPYCDMYVTKELHGLVIPLMTELHRLQDRIYKTDPVKLLTKRRFVNGIKEVISALKLRKAQMVILAPDIEPNSGQGGLDDKTTEIIGLAQENKVPYVFSGNRFILGRCIKQTKSPVSAIAILDKGSVEEQVNKVLEAAEPLRAKYQEEFNRRLKEVMANGG